MLITNTGVFETIAGRNVRDTLKLESWCHEVHQHVLPNAEKTRQRVKNKPRRGFYFVSSEQVQRNRWARLCLCPDQCGLVCSLVSKASVLFFLLSVFQRGFGTARGAGLLNGLVFDVEHLRSIAQ